MTNEQRTLEFIDRCKSIPGSFVIKHIHFPEPKGDISKYDFIHHDSFKDRYGNLANPILALFFHENKRAYQEGKHWMQVGNGREDLHHISYYLQIPHEFLLLLDSVMGNSIEIITFGFEDNWKNIPEIKEKVMMREALESLVKEERQR